MYSWTPLIIGDRKDGRSLSLALRRAAVEGRNVRLYYAPQRGWWGYVTTDVEIPDDPPRLRSVMDATGQMRSITSDVLRRVCDEIREGFPDEA